MTVAALPTSHRERKKLATRWAIHDAAFDLVENHGLAGTTVEAISERAGVAPRTFWSYFSSKEDAVINRDPEGVEKLRSALLARPDGEDAITSLRCVLEEYVSDRLIDSDRAVRRQHLVRGEPQLMAAVAASFDDVERSLVSAVAEREGRDPVRDLRPGVLVAAAGGACRVAQMRWADEPGRTSFHDLLDEAFAELAEGLAPQVAKRRAR
jgi:AcrR family transcriptional regulator